MKRIQELIEQTRPTPGPQAYYAERTVNEWLEKLAEQILDEVIDVVHRCDSSPQMVAHEKYRSIAHSVVDHFIGSETP
jgi:hypothetical protein